VGFFSGEVSPAQMRSSISERPFSGQLGSADMGEPVYQTAKISEISAEMRIVGLGRPTKHTLRCHSEISRKNNNEHFMIDK
jgi:hypothetical protein